MSDDNENRIIRPNVPQIAEMKTELVQLGGRPVNVMPKEFDIQVHPAALANAPQHCKMLGDLINTQNALIREVIELKGRLEDDLEAPDKPDETSDDLRDTAPLTPQPAQAE